MPESPTRGGPAAMSAIGRRNLVDSCIQAIVDIIQREGYAPGTQLPSEDMMASQLDVSRATVREALRMLEDRQVIVRKHGKGTFVAERPIEKDLSRNFGITTMIQVAGYRPSTTALTIGTGPAPALIAEKLQLPERAAVTTISRIRLADGRPVVASTDIVSSDLITPDDVHASSDDEHPSLYGLLYKTRGIVIYRGQAVLEPVIAKRDQAKQLEVKPGSPLLRISQIDYDDSGRPVVYSIEHHVADWVRFVIERLGPGRLADW